MGEWPIARFVGVRETDDAGGEPGRPFSFYGRASDTGHPVSRMECLMNDIFALLLIALSKE